MYVFTIISVCTISLFHHLGAESIRLYYNSNVVSSADIGIRLALCKPTVPLKLYGMPRVANNTMQQQRATFDVTPAQPLQGQTQNAGQRSGNTIPASFYMNAVLIEILDLNGQQANACRATVSDAKSIRTHYAILTICASRNIDSRSTLAFSTFQNTWLFVGLLARTSQIG